MSLAGPRNLRSARSSLTNPVDASPRPRRSLCGSATTTLTSEALVHDRLFVHARDAVQIDKPSCDPRLNKVYRVAHERSGTRPYIGTPWACMPGLALRLHSWIGISARAHNS